MSDNERLHLFAKDEKEYPFLSIGSCSDKTEKGALFFINFAVTQNDWQGYKGVKFIWVTI